MKIKNNYEQFIKMRGRIYDVDDKGIKNGIASSNFYKSIKNNDKKIKLKKEILSDDVKDKESENDDNQIPIILYIVILILIITVYFVFIR